MLISKKNREMIELTNAWKHFIENVKTTAIHRLIINHCRTLANEINDEFNFIYVYSYLPCC